jgi:hypothetical protein
MEKIRYNRKMLVLVLLLIVLALSSEVLSASTTTKNTGAFRFIVLPDMHITCGAEPFSQMQKDAVTAVLDAKPDFVISVGDLVDVRKEGASLNPACIDAMWASAQSDVISPISARTAFFFSPGRQDGLNYFGKDAQEIFDKQWSGFKNRNYPIDGKYGSYYSFDFGDSHFISLFAPGSPGLLDAEAQLTWLRADLEKARGKYKHIFTFAVILSEIVNEYSDNRCAEDASK